MKEQKNIDRLFQERFKDFEATPSDAVWKHIEAQLNQKKKKRRAIPIWWRYVGAAAILLLFLTMGGIYFNNGNTITITPTNQVVDTKKDVVEPTTSNGSKIFNNPNQKTFNSSDAVNELTSGESNATQQKTIIKPPAPVIANNPSKTMLLSTTKEKNQQVVQNPLASNGILATANANEKNQTGSAVGQSKGELDKSHKKNTVLNNAQTSIAKLDNNESVDTIAMTGTKNKLLTIEDAMAEATTFEEKKTVQNKWSIAPNAAPVYFSSLGKGSSIDSQFNNNSKSGEVNMSYGVTASYAITKNLKIRSGINKVNLGYNTNDVVVYKTIGISSSSRLLKNVDTNDASNNISIVSGASLINDSKSLAKTSNASINQSLGYIEVPLEIEYAVINKKLGLHVIGGFSSFFLNSNKLYSEFGGGRSLIGEATNLNKVSYSANLGFGLNYKLTQKFELNLEPMFKYQINTFSNTSGNFKPYFIGVYTGIGFKF